MRVPERRAVELNEVSWWSRWARLVRRGDGYLLSSDALREPFFNRAGALTCRGTVGTAEWAERYFGGSGMSTTFVAFASCASLDLLRSSGYVQVDRMNVLVSKGPAREVGDERGTVRASPGSWTAAYLRSFYGDEELTGTVKPIVVSILKDRAATLLERRAGGETAGVIALFRTQGVLGVYCVGTLPEHRRQGIATALLAKARQVAEKEGRSLVLQTLASEGAIQLYLDNGFEPMYDKVVLEKRLK